jgi:hypothetical protein
MKDTGYRDINNQPIFTEDTLYSPKLGEFKVKYRQDLGGMILCRSSPNDDDASAMFDDIQEMSYLKGHQFSIVGHGNDQVEEINRKIIALIARKSD